MTNLISMDVVARIWLAHREIEVAQKLIEEIRSALRRGEDATPLDPFGRRRPYTFGIPMGNDGQRLVDVSPELAAYMIEAHVARKQQELAEACVVARMELDGLAAESNDAPPKEDRR